MTPAPSHPTPAAHRLRSRTRRPWRVLTGLGATLVAVVAACGIPTDSGFEEMDQTEIGAELGDTVTTVSETTTTTTTMLPDDEPPPTTVASTSPSTTTDDGDTNIALEPVEVFFVTGPPHNEMLTSVTRQLSFRATLNQVASALAEGPPEPAGTGLRTLIDSDLVQSLTAERGVLTIDLDSSTFFGLDTTSSQRTAIAQLVLTFGSRPGIGQIQFTQDGEPFEAPVPLPGGGWVTRIDPVSAEEFLPVLADSAPSLIDDPSVTAPDTTDPDVTTAVDQADDASATAENGIDNGEGLGTDSGHSDARNGGPSQDQ